MKKLLFLSIAMVSLQFAQAQKINWETGNISVLKGQSNVATEIVYPDNFTVSEMPEAQFLAERIKSGNEDKAGSGDAFAESWKKGKESKYITRFCEHFTKASKQKVTAKADNADAKYIIILTPNNLDLGKGKYYGTKPALVDFDIVIAEKDNRSNIVAKGSAKEVKGESKAPKGSQWIPGGAGTAMDIAARSQNFDPTNRIAESFELLAVALGKALR